MAGGNEDGGRFRRASDRPVRGPAPRPKHPYPRADQRGPRLRFAPVTPPRMDKPSVRLLRETPAPRSGGPLIPPVTNKVKLPALPLRGFRGRQAHNTRYITGRGEKKRPGRNAPAANITKSIMRLYLLAGKAPPARDNVCPYSNPARSLSRVQRRFVARFVFGGPAVRSVRRLRRSGGPAKTSRSTPRPRHRHPFRQPVDPGKKKSALPVCCRADFKVKT